ncbi:acyl-CoA dehydrogenase family protein [Pseudonocardia sp. ICBG601]|uniref:acyl-CoA dehydrogenase family protein n=1 Tax=Pseudonocardia sp. ICBG601 TaxID=2846759 RepID=UPI001CF677CC|nr:acyl-CoA dehydrogenase family protein [Pseudonocardia sp. ICBG601]
MFFALTSDQQEFGAAVRDYLAQRFDLAAVRTVVENPSDDGNPASLWRAAGEQGWTAVTVDEDHDGLGLGLVEAQVIARALGAGVAPGPWRGTVLAADAIRLAGSDEQKAAWLPKLAAGEAVGAFTTRGSAASGLPVVEYGALADVVVAPAEDGLPGLALVTGATASPVGSYDGTTRLASCSGGTAEALPGTTVVLQRLLTDRAAVLVAADLVGIAREALTRTVAYDRERTQFGVPVGSFQALKHALADLHVGVTMAEHTALYAAARGGHRARRRRARRRRRQGQEQRRGAPDDRGDDPVHGGIGLHWEHEAHFFYKRAKRLAGQYGDVAVSRERIASLTVGA